MILPVILAGGSGTRLWPLSRALHPKQLLGLIDDQTMLQNTVSRLSGLPGIVDPMVICNEAHRFMVAEQLRRIGYQSGTIILEPVGRNTAPAVAVAAIAASSTGQDPVMLVLPADHFIEDIQRFHEILTTGVDLAKDDLLITFGVSPTSPETGYGYIQKGDALPVQKTSEPSVPEANRIQRFVEKPDIDNARAYVDSGDYRWNSGMFMFRASSYLEELERYAPEMVTACRTSYDHGIADLDFFRLDPDAFENCPADSIDYAVMEHTTRGVMVTFDAGWNDVGSWEALWQIGEKDDSDNIIRGDALISDVQESYINATSRLVAAVGLTRHVVVETPDAVMISPRHRVQDVKALVEELKKAGRQEARAHRKVYRPWGWMDRLIESPRFRVNHIAIKPGAGMSLQKHFKRTEHWVVVEGRAQVTKNSDSFDLGPNESTFIPRGVPHRLQNPGKETVEIIEIQTGSAVDDDDIERLEEPAFG